MALQSNQVNQTNQLGKQGIKETCMKLREKYDWAFAGIRPQTHQMLVDINDLKWMISCIERLNK